MLEHLCCCIGLLTIKDINLINTSDYFTQGKRHNLKRHVFFFRHTRIQESCGLA
jgi:hypothetical protein